MSFPARSEAFRKADAALNGELVKWLREQREAEKSHEEIAVSLRLLGVVVSRESVRSWCARFDVDGVSA